MTKKSAKFYDSAKKLYRKFGVMCTLKLLQQTHKLKRETIDAFKKRRAKNFGTRDHLNQRIEWYLQMC